MDKYRQKLSKHFYREEFACKCGCGFDTVDAELLKVAEAIRGVFGAFTPNSGCRCVKNNEHIQIKYNPDYVPMSSKSQHLIGRAMDVPSNDPKNYMTILIILTLINLVSVCIHGVFILTQEKKKDDGQETVKQEFNRSFWL